MSSRRNRNRAVLPLSSTPKPDQVKPASDRERLYYEKVMGVLQGVQAQLGALQIMAVEQMMQSAGVDPLEGWKFNPKLMRYEKHPVE